MTLTPRQVASCLDAYDPDAMRLDTAADFLQRWLTPCVGTEQVGLRQALGRTLAQDLIAPHDVPNHDNSAMDGYAFHGQDLRPGTDTRLRCVGATLLAGQAATMLIGAGQCVRIMTGAPMPAGLDTVVPQEMVEVLGDEVIIPAGKVSAGDNRRLAGEDLRRGSPALTAGKRLGPAEIGVAASMGMAELTVFQRVKVAFFSTGDELYTLGTPLPEGGVYDSNRYTLWSLISELGADPIDLGVVRDHPVALREAFQRAAQCADLVLTSGGVSVGEADHTKAVMAQAGEVLFWKVAMRPGRPLAIGHLKHPQGLTPILGLPGNPVAVMVAFHAFARQAILQLGGVQACRPQAWMARAANAMRKKPGRTEFQRVVLTLGADGIWQARATGAQGSGILSSMSQADGLAVLPHDSGEVREGDWLSVWPLSALR